MLRSSLPVGPFGEETRQLRAKIGEALKSGSKNILLNIRDVSSIDSAGSQVLYCCHYSSYTVVANHGGQLQLLDLTKGLKELLAITKLLTVFDTYDDEARAVESFT